MSHLVFTRLRVLAFASIFLLLALIVQSSYALISQCNNCNTVSPYAPACSCSSDNHQYCYASCSAASYFCTNWTAAGSGAWSWQQGSMETVFGNCTATVNNCASRFCGGNAFYCTKDVSGYWWWRDSGVCFSGDGCCPSSCSNALGSANYDSDCQTVSTTPTPSPAASCGGCSLDASGANIVYNYFGDGGACVSTSYNCNASSKCWSKPCGSQNYNCTLEGNIWAWRQGSVSCDDGNPCTSGDFCTSGGFDYGTCSGIAITYCQNGDGCCPSACSNAADNDCAAPTQTPAPTPTLTPTLTPSPTVVPTNYPPTVFLLFPANASFANAAPVFSINAIDDNSPLLNCTISAWREGNPATTLRSISNSSVYNATGWNASFDQSFSEGKWEWNAQCADAGGALDSTMPNKVFVDFSPPRINVEWPVNVTNATAAAFYANVSDNGALEACEFIVGSSFKANLSLENKTSYLRASRSYTFSQTGIYNVSIICLDKAKNSGINSSQISVSSQFQETAANASVTPSPTPTPAPNASITPTPVPTANATATPAPSITPIPTPAPTAYPSHFMITIDGQNTVSADFGNHSSSFNLSYALGASGFEGTVSYRLPFDYALFQEGRVSFSPQPSTVTQGSIIAYWQASLAPQQAFTATINVAEVFNESILQQFTAAMIEAATPTPGPTQTATPTATPFATPTPLPVTSLQPVSVGTGTLTPPPQFAQEPSSAVVRPAIKVEFGESQAKAKAESFIVNITNFVTDSDKVPFAPIEFGGNGTVFSTTNLSEISCEGKTPCSCSFTTGFIAEGGQNTTWFRCTFQPIVNGSYSIVVFDQYNHLGKYRLSLVPGQSPVLFRVVETAAATDPLFTALLVLVLLSMVAGTAYLVREKMESEKNKRLALFNKKAQIENDFKLLKYRYLKREIDELTFRKLWDAKEKGYSEVKARILEQQEKEKKGKTQSS